MIICYTHQLKNMRAQHRVHDYSVAKFICENILKYRMKELSTNWWKT